MSIASTYAACCSRLQQRTRWVPIHSAVTCLRQLLHGLRTSFAVSAMAAVCAVVLGTALGLSAGFAGGKVDYVLMRAVDVFQSQNHFLLSIMIAVLFRPVFGPAGDYHVCSIPDPRGDRDAHRPLATAQLAGEVFCRAAINGGASPWRLVWRHFIPHLLPSIMLAFVLLVPHAIFHESGLSFLGLGMPPHDPSLGSLLAESRQTMLSGGWWLAVFPGAVIFLASAAVGIWGEYWRDRLHPQWGSELELG